MATLKIMMTSSNGNILCVTAPLWGESTDHWWIPLTKTSDAEFWFFFFDVRLNKRLNKQRSCCWFQTSMWRHYNVVPLIITILWASRHLNPPVPCPFAQKFVQPGIKGNTNASLYWPFVGGIHLWPVQSKHACWITSQNMFRSMCMKQYHKLRVQEMIITQRVRFMGPTGGSHVGHMKIGIWADSGWTWFP